MTTFTIAGTGSRSLITDADAFADVKTELTTLMMKGAEKYETLTVISGGAEGFDEAIARAAIQAQLMGAINILLAMYLPYKGYLKYYWRQASMLNLDRYQEMVDICTIAQTQGGVHYTADRVEWIRLGQGPRKCALNPRTGNWEEVNNIRNMDMVDASDKMWVYNKKSTGTANCFRYIKQVGKPFYELRVR